MNLTIFIFSLIFIYFYFQNLKFRFSMMIYITITICHSHLLLFLLPPSCIVASIGNIANKLFFSSNFSSSTTSNSQAFILPTMLSSNNTGMDILAGSALDNFDKVRGRNSSTNKNISRNISMSSTISSIAYHERMVNNGMDIDSEPMNNPPDLSYETEQEKAIHISKATKLQENIRPLFVTPNMFST